MHTVFNHSKNNTTFSVGHTGKLCEITNWKDKYRKKGCTKKVNYSTEAHPLESILPLQCEVHNRGGGFLLKS